MLPLAGRVSRDRSIPMECINLNSLCRYLFDCARQTTNVSYAGRYFPRGVGLKTLRRLTLGTIIAAWVCAAGSSTNSVSPQLHAAGGVPASTDEQQTLVRRYCVTCHNSRLKTGGLALDTLDVADVGTH